MKPSFRWAVLALALLCAAGSASADTLCLTGNARGRRNCPVAFTVQPEQAKKLCDGSLTDRNSAGFPRNTGIRFTFAAPVQVTGARLSFFNDPPRTYNAAQRARLIAYRDGAVKAESPWTPLTADPELSLGADDAFTLSAEAEARLETPCTADTVVVEVEKKPEAHQMLLREISVWGLPEALTNAPAAPLRFQAADNTYSSIRVSWEKAPAGTGYVRVRFRERGAREWQTICFTQSPGIIPCLTPTHSYEILAEAVGAKGTGKPAKAQTVTLPHPLAVRRMGDLWGMNFYPLGGGAHQAQADETANSRHMRQLLQAAGVRHVRWWIPTAGAADFFREAGISLLPTCIDTNPERYARLAREAGVWVTATGNEPDYGNLFAREYVRICIPRRAAARQFSPLMLLTGPVLGGELCGPGSDYLAEAYAAGLKNAVDVIDIHPYGKYTTPTPPGGILGSPEGTLNELARCKAEIRKAEAAGTPIIVSETGAPTYEGAWFMPASSPERQAQWIVRDHLLLAASGVRRIYWYDFQDEGTDRRNPEHNFGIVDWHGNPKPAYATYQVMTRLLSAARCEGLDAAAKAPVYAVRCAVSDGYITAVWDCGGKSEVRLDAASGIQRVVGLTGEKMPLPQRAGKALVLPATESVRYVFSKRPLRILGQRRLAPPVEPQVQMTLQPSTVQVRPGETCRWQVQLASEYACPVHVTLTTGNPWRKEAPKQEVTLPPRGQATVAMSMESAPEAKPRLISWDVRCHYQPEDTRHPGGDVFRAIFFEAEP